MNNVYVVGPKDKNYPNKNLIMTVSKSRSWTRGLSPFILGPCVDYDGLVSENMENLWQYDKCYHIHLDENNNPTEEYFKWRKAGFKQKRANRYPMGKGSKPAYSYWNGEKLKYIEARKKIYIPQYYKAVKNTSAFATLKLVYESRNEDLYLWDYDGYNHKQLNMTFDEVVNCENKKMGHAFVIYAMLTGEIEPYVN